MSDSDEISWENLPLEIRVLIAGYDPKIFQIVRTYDPDVREFTNERITEYKKRFSKKIIEVLYQSKRYYVLPNGVEHGLWQKWHNNGQLWIQCIYKDGELDGLYQEWYYNGQLLTQCTYKNWKLDGLYQRWYSNSQLWTQCVYNDGKIDTSE